MSTAFYHPSGGTRPGNCSSSSVSEPAGTCATARRPGPSIGPVQVCPVDSSSKTPGSAWLQITFSFLTVYSVDGIKNLRCLVGGLAANVISASVDPHGNANIVIEWPYGQGLLCLRTQLVLVWTSPTDTLEVVRVAVSGSLNRMK